MMLGGFATVVLGLMVVWLFIQVGDLRREVEKLRGDPNAGGATRHGIVTAYRQDALRCAAHLAEAGATKGSAVAKATGVGRATALMSANHYGWFERVSTGIYQLTEAGSDGLKHWAYSWEPEAGLTADNSPG